MRTSSILGVLALAGAMWSQSGGPERVSVAFSDPSRPGTVKASLLNGGITVRGYNGKEVIVEARSRDEHPTRSRPNPKAEGLHRLNNPNTGLSVDEQDNVMSIGTRSYEGTVDLVLQVPYNTSLNLKCINSGDIDVDNVKGEIDANDLNGAVNLKNISGAVVAHALNRDVNVSFDQVAPGKAMSFSSMNGDLDVTLPADTRARLKLKTQNGEIYSDFEIKLEGQPQAQPQRQNGHYRLQFDRAMYGTINGGGPEMQLTTFNGKIYIRKKK